MFEVLADGEGEVYITGEVSEIEMEDYEEVEVTRKRKMRKAA